MPLSSESPAHLGELDARGDADANDDEVAVDRAPVVELDALDARVPDEATQAGAGEQLDAVVAVDLRVQAADLAAEDVLERDLGAFDDRDVAADLPRRGGDLGPDPAGSDDDQVRAARQPRAQCVGVGEIAQRQHAVEVGAGDIETARARAGREQQAVVAHAARRRRA